MSTNPPHETWDYLSRSEAETEAFGARLADALEPGAVVALVGNLGAGKTRLVQAVAAAMGVERREVASPTYILIHEYEGRLPIYHFDTYRLRDSDEFLELGSEEYLHSEGVCLIEWADRVADVLPADMLSIEIEIAGPSERVFHVRGGGPCSMRIVERLRSAPP